MREEFLMPRLRTAAGFSIDEFRRQFGQNSTEKLLCALEKFSDEGLIIRTEDKIRIPSEKFLLSDHIIGSLFDL